MTLTYAIVQLDLDLLDWSVRNTICNPDLGLVVTFWTFIFQRDHDCLEIQNSFVGKTEYRYSKLVSECLEPTHCKLRRPILSYHTVFVMSRCRHQHRRHRSTWWPRPPCSPQPAATTRRPPPPAPTHPPPPPPPPHPPIRPIRRRPDIVVPPLRSSSRRC